MGVRSAKRMDRKRTEGRGELRDPGKARCHYGQAEYKGQVTKGQMQPAHKGPAGPEHPGLVGACLGVLYFI